MSAFRLIPSSDVSRGHGRTAVTKRIKGSNLRLSTMSSSHGESHLMQDMLARIREVNDVPDDLVLMDFVVDGQRVGRVAPETADRLVSTSTPSSSPVFEIVDDDRGGRMLTLARDVGDDCESRTSAVMTVMLRLREEGVLKGWRDELYPVATSFDQADSPLLSVERVSAPLLGVLQYGVHVNGLVRDDDDDDDTRSQRREPRMWIARRSASKSKYPGMLDHIVAGGQPTGVSLADNVVKECGEEAGVPPSLAERALPAGAISYETQVRFANDDDGVLLRGLERSVLFCYDLYLPPDFEPKVVDGEVDEFYLWDMEKVRESMSLDFHDPIKPNCYPVIIDYLMRMGFLGEGADADSKGYLDVLRDRKSVV